jgi:chromosome segregation ATPase
MKRVEEYQAFRGSMESRIDKLQIAEKSLEAELEAKRETMRQAMVEGDFEAQRQAVKAGEVELADVQEELAVLLREWTGHTQSPHQLKLRMGALDEIRSAVSEKRQQWQEEIRPRLEAKKAEFLELVEQAGAHYREGSALIGKFLAVVEHVPGPKPGVPGFMSDVVMRPDKKVGAIFVLPEESEKAFRKGA